MRPSWRGAIFRKALSLLVSCAIRSASSNNAINPDTNRAYNEIVIGGLGFQDEGTLYAQWNDTFSAYLSEVVGPKFGVTFKLVNLNFITTYKAVERREVDMVYTNPSVYACLEREYSATPIVSLRNRRKVGTKFYELDHFYGTIFVKTNSSITKISEIENKVVEAVSLIGLGACQLQWVELSSRGISFLSAPRQVRFAFSQKKIVKDVISGAVDVGMVRTDLAEAMVSDGEIEPGLIRVLENLQGTSHDPGFPFPYSTRLAAPEWTLAALPWTSWNLTKAVSQALMDITPAHQAAVSGMYATWVAPLSSLGMHQMQAELNLIDGDDKCVRAGDFCETVVCPTGQLKKSCAEIEAGCELVNEPCPEGYTCVCDPCHPLVDKTCGGREHFEFVEKEGKCVCRFGYEQPPGESVCVEVAGSNSSTTVIVVVSALTFAALAVVAGAWAYRTNGHRRDDSWKISLSELKFPEPSVVLGRGTYGQVLLAVFRSTPVAVKRVMPKMHVRVDAANEATEIPDPVLSFTEMVDVMVTELQAPRLAGPPLGPRTDGARGRASLSADTPDHYRCSRHNQEESGSNGSSAETRAGVAETKAPGAAHESASVDVGASTKDAREEGGARSRRGTSHASSDEPLHGASQPNQARHINRGFNDNHRYRVTQTVLGDKAPRASEMQLQVRPQDDTGRRDSVLTQRDSRWSGGLTKALNFHGHAHELPVQRRSGNRTSIDLGQHKDLTQDFLREMQVLVFLRHPNIVTVMGAVTDKKLEPLMVMEYMKHGSLYDLMHNHTMQFDSELVMGILEGVVSGMMYLHSATPPVLHNDLKSGNVLVGLNFTAKLADFGLSMKRKSCGFLGTPFWMAPELFTFGCKPSVKTDVFSFGVTLYELLTRKEPYEEHESLEDVLDKLADAALTPPLRPTLPEGLPADAVAIMQACWDPDPDARPSFEQIKLLVSRLDTKEVDAWFARESGARGQRTANQLLYDVFPQRVADTLRQGKKVEPEHHEAVTIFFSDIVGFTDISRQLQPIEVMDMLDRLYASFDSISQKYDIFKVETIGDAYMAVANLVKQQPNHAERVARFALEAIKVANQTMIKEDCPELGCVNIRAGFHSGPVVSSVVGNMNPRFCLFGDTVNTSSRMESTSQKNRIHLSDVAAIYLMQQAPNALVTCRGIIPIKGKSDMKTYWLVGFASDCDEHSVDDSDVHPDVSGAVH